MTARRIGIAALFALLALQLAWHAWLAPPTVVPTWLVLAVFALPLAVPAIGVLRGRRTALFWGGLVSLLHFCHGVSEAWTTPDVRGLALMEVALSLTLIAAIGYDGLQRRRAARPGPAHDEHL